MPAAAERPFEAPPVTAPSWGVPYLKNPRAPQDLREPVFMRTLKAKGSFPMYN